MGRIVGMGVALAAAGIVAIVLLGPGKDKLKPRKPVVAVTPAVSPETSGGPAAPVGATVRMRDLLFQAPVVHVRPGQAVEWINSDVVNHTVVQNLGPGGAPTPQFSSERDLGHEIRPGGIYRVVFHTSGSVAFVCTLHPTIMTGRVIVGTV